MRHAQPPASAADGSCSCPKAAGIYPTQHPPHRTPPPHHTPTHETAHLNPSTTRSPPITPRTSTRMVRQGFVESVAGMASPRIGLEARIICACPHLISFLPSIHPSIHPSIYPYLPMQHVNGEVETRRCIITGYTDPFSTCHYVTTRPYLCQLEQGHTHTRTHPRAPTHLGEEVEEGGQHHDVRVDPSARVARHARGRQAPAPAAASNRIRRGREWEEWAK
jgi:hypothetical protein